MEIKNKKKLIDLIKTYSMHPQDANIIEFYEDGGWSDMTTKPRQVGMPPLTSHSKHRTSMQSLIISAKHGHGERAIEENLKRIESYLKDKHHKTKIPSCLSGIKGENR